jgi:pimeloyl-ACP methyl ester carboxylesterase
MNSTTSSFHAVVSPIDAPPIVFVHGTRLTGAMWHPQLRALSDEFRVTAPDMPGHGVLADQPFRLDAAAQHVADVIDELANGRALVVGLSMGGYVTMRVAQRFPEKTAGLTLAGCSTNPIGVLTCPYQGVAALTGLIPHRWLTWLNRAVFRQMWPQPIAQPLIDAGFYFKAVPDVIHQIVGHDFVTVMRSYAGPVLFVNGVRDVAFRRGEVEFMRATRRGQLCLIERAAHLSNLDQPAAFNQAVRTFARSLAW